MPHEIAAASFVFLGSAEADAPFLTGLRADLLSALATRPGLKVYSASFDPMLDADYTGHTLQIAVTRTETHLHLLCSVHAPSLPTRADALTLELAMLSTAACRIAERVLGLLDGRAASSPRPRPQAALSQAAYEHLLLGRHHASAFTPAGNEAALEHLRAVLDEVPSYAPALAALAAITFQQIRYGTLGASHYTSVQDAAEAAIDADPANVQAHVIRALVGMYHDRDFRAAADAFGDALALDRDHVDVLKEYAWLLCATGHDVEAIRAIDRALEYDPISVDLLCTKASLYRYAHDPASALRLYRRAHALDLRYARAIEGIASMASVLGDRDDAFRYLDLYRRHAPNRNWRYRLMGEIAARFGDEALFAEAIRLMDAYALEHPEADLSADLASVYAATDPDRAMRHLTDAFHHGIGFVSVLRYPTFDPLRSLDAYRQLVASLDLNIDVPELVVSRTRVLRFAEGTADELVLPHTAFLYAEAQRNYVMVHAARGSRRTRHLLRTSLSALVDRLAEPDWMRVHHSFVVNLAQPGWRLEGNAHTATLQLDRQNVEVPVSRARYREVRDALAA
ncbi:MAG: LytTR family transcriptional regulator DNA-binding domain-containing protein [Bacteroidota bacterium]